MSSKPPGGIPRAPDHSALFPGGSQGAQIGQPRACRGGCWTPAPANGHTCGAAAACVTDARSSGAAGSAVTARPTGRLSEGRGRPENEARPVRGGGRYRGSTTSPLDFLTVYYVLCWLFSICTPQPPSDRPCSVGSLTASLALCLKVARDLQLRTRTSDSIP